jgi:hypothetical protein
MADRFIMDAANALAAGRLESELPHWPLRPAPDCVVDMSRQYNHINQDWIEQDHVLYAWSDSTCQYEEAWWLDRRADVSMALVAHLRDTRWPPMIFSPL